MANTNSLQLNGTTQRVTAAQWQPTVFTISSWIKPTVVNADQWIFAGPQNDMALGVDASGKLYLNVWTGSAYETYTSIAGISANTWTFVAATYTQSTKTWALYIGTGSTADNSGTGTLALSWEGAPDNIAWGSRAADQTKAFGGLLDDSREWSVARTGIQIASDNSQELIGNESNLYGYYKWNNDLTDSATTPHNGTGIGSPTFSTDIPAWIVSSNLNYSLFL